MRDHLSSASRRVISIAIQLLVLSALLAAYCLGTDAILTHNATLRSDPSSAHPPILTLKAKEDIELLSTTATHGYYHVRTSEGQEGWIYGRSLQIASDNVAPSSGTASSSTSASTTTASGAVSSAVPGDWDKPDPNHTQYEGVDGACGPNGDGGDSTTNLRKNRTDVPASYHQVSWKAFQALPYPTAGRSLDQWTADQLAVIQPYEGIPVIVVGYLDAIKIEGAESTNCHFTNPEEVDWHMPLVEHSLDQEATSIVVETTPRVRQTHPKWTQGSLAAWVKSDQPVRISGWSLLDPEHRAHLGKYRSTLWEIHPITKIEVFENGQWVDLDDHQ
jgi:hypothetical protein